LSLVAVNPQTFFSGVVLEKLPVEGNDGIHGEIIWLPLSRHAFHPFFQHSTLFLITKDVTSPNSLEGPHL